MNRLVTPNHIIPPKAGLMFNPFVRNPMQVKQAADEVAQVIAAKIIEQLKGVPNE